MVEIPVVATGVVEALGMDAGNRTVCVAGRFTGELTGLYSIGATPLASAAGDGFVWKASLVRE